MTLPANWTLVPAVATPILLEEAIQAAIDAWPMVIGDPVEPTPTQLGIFIGHCALECGNFGYKNGKPADPPTLYCNDWGNTRPGQHETCEVCQYSGNEIIGGKVRKFAPPDDLSTFRAFKDAALGCEKQLEFVANSIRYHQAWLRLLAGDPAGYVRCLKAGGYMTGDEGPYERAVVSITAHVVPIAARMLAGEHHGITDADRERIEGLVALTTLESAEEALHPGPPPEVPSV